MPLRRSRGGRLPGEIEYRKLEQMLRLAGCVLDPSGRRGDHVKITRRLPDGSFIFSTVQQKNNIPEVTYKAVLREPTTAQSIRRLPGHAYFGEGASKLGVPLQMGEGRRRSPANMAQGMRTVPSRRASKRTACRIANC